jgi:hypothetical protein
MRLPGGAIEIRGAGAEAGGESAAGCRDLVLRRSGCPIFCLRPPQAAAAKKQENRPLKKNKENV